MGNGSPIVPASPSTGAVNDLEARDVQIPPTAPDVDPLVPQHQTIPLDKTRADFRPKEFERVLQQHGKFIIWRKAMLCPCIRAVTGQADLDCEDCDGSGYVYVDPLNIRAHMASFDSKTRLYEKFGLWVSGEVQVTTEATYRLNWRDSLEMRDDLMGFNEVIEKGNRHGVRSSLAVDTDSARYRIAHLTKAMVRSGNSVIPLEVGYHLMVDDNGHVKWRAPGNKIVEDGAFVSLRYDFKPVYIVISHPHALRSDVRGTKVSQPTVDGLPLQAAAQLDFLNRDVPRDLPVTGGC
jgi:hypothetical protein